ncbi:MAG: hypothetical protein ACRDPF_23605 [Streptosporangiaceae bacterium]
MLARIGRWAGRRVAAGETGVGGWSGDAQGESLARLIAQRLLSGGALLAGRWR